LFGSHGDVMSFCERPISGTIMAIAILLFVLPLIKAAKGRLSRRRAAGSP
ncbi:MAG: hypothetical protein IID48_21430, partial [Proteobacteria bacterium]|nr:hypothetical protein [Pseudomonadota bacterium]